VLEVEGGNLYVTLRNMQPISLLLSEDGVLESEISIVLVPISSPPAMVDINIEMTPEMIAKAEQHQENMERERQLEEALSNQQMTRNNRNSTHANNQISILKPIAQGKTPPGFSMTNDIPEHMSKPCRISVYHKAGQRLTGARELIDVVLVQNDSNRVYHVREEMCLSDGALAVGIYPRAYLQPGEETEVYIVRDKYHEPAEQRVTRPRLTRGTE
jgi:conjugal transfer pilus assembly protein TraK